MTTPAVEPCADCPPPVCGGWCGASDLPRDAFGICLRCKPDADAQLEDLASTVCATAEEDDSGHAYVGAAALLAGALVSLVNDTAQPWNRAKAPEPPAPGLAAAIAAMRHHETCAVYLVTIEPGPDHPDCDCGLAAIARAAAPPVRRGIGTDPQADADYLAECLEHVLGGGDTTGPAAWLRKYQQARRAQG